MAIYAIGDVHGCYGSLKRLLERIHFNPQQDRLLFVGDLINRGPDSLDVVRFVQDLGERAVVLMGNHEAWIIGALCGNTLPFFQDYLQTLKGSKELDTMFDWWRGLPFIHQEPELGITMVHAGLHPHWSMATCLERAEALHQLFMNPSRLTQLMQSFPDRLIEEDPGTEDPVRQAQFDLALFTRIRLCTAQGALLWPRNRSGLSPYQAPKGGNIYQPWYQQRRWVPGEHVIYGHWAAAGLTLHAHCTGLDAGCVYGGRLSALRLDHPQRPLVQIPCPESVRP
ncbi:MAG: symmetrical bis(5'-nucleosyl)-tetraphosphatase [Magnetococcales bacterium]|nr:symmetrical bis(5'-nucleosyl)-tetraphosphatase [Magnetococcales bacterium]